MQFDIEEELKKLTEPAYLDKLLKEELSDLNLAAKSGKQDGHLQTGGQTGKDTPEKPGNHILIIDDDTRMLRILKEELREKYNVATAVSGKIALNFLEKRKTAAFVKPSSGKIYEFLTQEKCTAK